MDGIDNAVAAKTEAEDRIAQAVDVAKTAARPAREAKLKARLETAAAPPVLAEPAVSATPEAAPPPPASADAAAPSPADADMVRGIAEHTVATARAGYDAVRAAADDTTGAIEETFAAARHGFVDLNLKLIALARVNSETNFGFVRQAMNVRTFADAVELQAAFARQQIRTMTEQTREFRDLATRIATDTAAPLRQMLTKAGVRRVA